MYLDVVQAAVVVPVFREDSDTLDRCIGSWPAEDPGEVIVVPGLRDVEAIERSRIPAAAHPRLVVRPFAQSGKRPVLRAGIRQSRGQIPVLADSGTAWEPGALKAVQARYQAVYQPNAPVMPAARPTRAPTEANVGAGQHAGRDGRRAGRPFGGLR
jgi:hypothetical protein